MSATLFVPSRNTQPAHKQVQVTVGDPEDSFVMVEPYIGSILAGKDLDTGGNHEIRLTLFHDER
jgi:hypothetical protein